MELTTELERLIAQLRKLAASEGPATADLKAAIRAVESARAKIERGGFPQPRGAGKFMGMVRPPIAPPCT